MYTYKHIIYHSQFTTGVYVDQLSVRLHGCGLPPPRLNPLRSTTRRAQSRAGGYATPPIVLLRRIGHCVLCVSAACSTIYNA